MKIILRNLLVFHYIRRSSFRHSGWTMNDLFTHAHIKKFPFCDREKITQSQSEGEQKKVEMVT